MGKPKTNQYFKDYCAEISASQVKKHGHEYSSGRIDVVFDMHKQEFKRTTRLKKKQGVRRKVQNDSLIPSKWNRFFTIGGKQNWTFSMLFTRNNVRRVEWWWLSLCIYRSLRIKESRFWCYWHGSTVYNQERAVASFCTL